MTFHVAPMTKAARLQKTLSDFLSPTQIEVIDDLTRHAGHAGAQPGGETHYTITIVSKFFTGKSRLERHRMVNDALAREFASGLHALQLSLKAPEEMT